MGGARSIGLRTWSIGVPAGVLRYRLAWGHDQGRYQVAGRNEDRGAFKTPTLRNVERTAPYMHDGSIAALEAVIELYDRAGNPNPYLDADLRPLELTSEEKQALVIFLHALSGRVQDGIPTR